MLNGPRGTRVRFHFESCKLLSFGWVLLVSWFLAGPLHLAAQAVDDPPHLAAAALPEAPQPASTATLSGTVLDGQGQPIPHTTVTVTGRTTATRRTVRVHSNGAWSLAGLPADSYTVTIAAPGIQPVPPEELTIAAGASASLPIVATRLPTFTSTVHVTANNVQLATQQVRLAEKQRVLGVIPNFYTSYDWNAAAMTPNLKFRLSFRSLIDPLTFATTAGIAGVEQWRNIYPGYGRGAEGYGKRYGAAFADTAINHMVGDALLPAVFHQDPRYFYHGSGSTGSRLLYALRETVMCRGDQGGQQVNYSRILGSFIAAGASNLYHSPQDRSAGTTVRDALIINAASAFDNVVREFLPRGLTSHVPPGAQGRP